MEKPLRVVLKLEHDSQVALNRTLMELPDNDFAATKLARHHLEALVGYYDGREFGPAKGWSDEEHAVKSINYVLTALNHNVKRELKNTSLRVAVDNACAELGNFMANTAQDIVRAATEAGILLEMTRKRQGRS